MRYPMQLCILLPTLFSFPFTASALPAKRHDKPPVCIIGAGPAGLTAAARLEAKGIEAVVFDKQSELGGKCQSYYSEEGIFHPLGAAFFSNGTYPETVKVVDDSGVSIEEFALAGARQQFFFNVTTGAIKPVPALTASFQQQIASEIPRYIQLWNRDFAPISTTYFQRGVPKAFTVSGAEWFRSNNFTALPIIAVNPLALYGYGDINLVPALYVLKYLTPDLLTGAIGQHPVYYTDFHKVFEKWAEKRLCKTPIKLSHEVRCIDRSEKNPVIKYTKPHGNFYKWGKQECDSLIFAFPPTIANLERTGLDITEEEYEVFKDVEIMNYYSSAVELALPFGVSYIAKSASPDVPPPNNGEPVAVLRLSAKSNISTAWSWGPYEEFQAESTALDLLNTTLSLINKDPRNATTAPVPLRKDQVRAFRKWDYFPHFDTEPLRNGAYAKLNRLQGCNKSFWVSGLAGMELVEWAIRAGQDIVEMYY
ncbi:FAD/NAD(P)-binding domain-containing protein [Periconia macrospinosa]|uniref:FAD/NAD(P)-binding domain-containing protein n=1 Tax=Periconia macrospinosa TaxID=97972 RepID=A0A2V1DXP3_9PLEO|nr:FAD/NAD(P)-binding domain-containing protein [Periconia macrospinosa]